MNILKLDETNLTKNEETGAWEYKKDLVFDGAIEIAENLGSVRFCFGISATRYIWAKAGSGIEAGEGIEAGWGIKASRGIAAARLYPELYK